MNVVMFECEKVVLKLEVKVAVAFPRSPSLVIGTQDLAQAFSERPPYLGFQV